ncbi:MAG: UDP-N-acetylmuramoyl-L-alanine--D-glutamate ligase [Lachnospiraceae bacterium]|nr:UDP-N-acetylmuramoyl-L-alanine--D-glutamate ligase [Lachnospiraceae bacterium]
MKTTIKEAVKDKRILIWGYGREGKASENYIKNNCEPKSVEVFQGKLEDIFENDYDMIIKSPGIVMQDYEPYNKKKFTSQTELFLNEYRDQVIGITGTKGKSTTSAMMAHVLRQCTGRPVILLGNIGFPCMDYCDEITEDTIIVFELSCHQMRHTKVSPHVSVFLNLYEDHLDYYHSMDQYFLAKSHIATYQEEGDYFYKGENVPEIDTKAKTKVIKASDVVGVPLRVFGEHNQLNATFVRNIARDVYGCSDGDITYALSLFSGLSHRLQSIGEYAGINWYDDSISTIPEAAVGALKSIPGVKTILIGGMDRGIDYDLLEDFMAENGEYNYVCMYESGKRVHDEFLYRYPQYRNAGAGRCVLYVPNLQMAVDKAAEITPKGSGCVLSPAAASYGYFKNFEDRGDRFAEMVKAL